jgi:hypothetical protein
MIDVTSNPPRERDAAIAAILSAIPLMGVNSHQKTA